MSVHFSQTAISWNFPITCSDLSIRGNRSRIFMGQNKAHNIKGLSWVIPHCPVYLQMRQQLAFFRNTPQQLTFLAFAFHSEDLVHCLLIGRDGGEGLLHNCQLHLQSVTCSKGCRKCTFMHFLKRFVLADTTALNTV